MSMNRTTTPRIFISYSHRGNGPKWKSALLRPLQLFEQHRLLDVWQDGRIRVSSFWDDDIKQAMESARLAIVLLTPEALESEYILDTEFPFLRRRQEREGLPVFPIVCEECDWKAHDWLRATQAPNGGAPLSGLPDSAQEAVFRALAADIAYELSRMALAELPAPEQPLQPARLHLDRFPLARSSGLREEVLIGREQELALLDLAFAQQHTALASLVAWGGVGKSMLVRHWLRRLQREGWYGARRVYAWSFYSQGTWEDRQASEDTFLAHALAWFGVQCEPTLSPWDKGRLLADAVARERTLLILDGVEPLQYPPGPMGGQLRAPGIQTLLRQLAGKRRGAENRGLCLVTSREPLADLAEYEHSAGAAWGSVLRLSLGNLAADAGAALLHHAGAQRAGAAEIGAADAELVAASREVGGHALTLHLLGRFLARAHGGDIRRRDLVRFEVADREEQGGTTFRMLAAFENWFARSGDFGARQLAVLRLLGLFDRPADAACIAALRKPPVIAGLTEPLFAIRLVADTGQAAVEPLLEEDWATATSFLADFGLLAIEAGPDQRDRLLDCHPLIREHFAQQARAKHPEAWRAAHGRLYTHLKGSAEYQPATLEGLHPLYQAIRHGCEAGKHEEACFRVYLDRVLRDTDRFFSVKTLGAVSDDLSAVACFFERPWGRLAPSLPWNAQASLLGTAAFHLQALGRLGEAAEPMRASLELFEARGVWEQAVIAASDLADLQLTLGDIQGALRDGEHSAALAMRHLSPVGQLAWRARFAHVLDLAGRTAEALEEFRQCEKEYAARSPFGLLYSTQGFYYCECILGEAEETAWRLQTGAPARREAGLFGRRAIASLVQLCGEIEKRARKTLGVAERGGRPLDIALDNLTLGRVLLVRALLMRAPLGAQLPELRSRAAAVIEGLRAAAHQDELPRGFLFRAWLRHLEGDAAGARADLDEAWEIAERGPMRLHMADIRLYRARLFRDRSELQQARDLIESCGYGRRKVELADATGAARAW